MTQTLSTRQIADAIYELAAAAAQTVDEFICGLISRFDNEYKGSHEGLPEEVVKELDQARQGRISRYRQERDALAASDMQNDIDEFITHFPKVNPEDIPSVVWEQVANGAKLCYAYALYICDEANGDDYATAANKAAEMRAAPSGAPVADGEYTPDMVDAMSQKDIKKNYKGILASIKKWKI